MIVKNYRNCLKCDNEIILIQDLNKRNNIARTVCDKCGSIHTYHLHGRTAVLQIVDK